MGSRRSRRVPVTWVVVAGALVVMIVAAVVVVFEGRAGEQPAGDLAGAVEAGDLVAARQLLADGADPDAPRVHQLTPLMRAAVRDDAPMARLLVDAGAEIEATDPDGLRALHVAARVDAVDVVRVLLDAGADAGIRSRNGMAAIHHAAAFGGVGTIELLVASGVDADLPSDVVTQGHGAPRDVGARPLALAARNGQAGAVATLLALGAGVDGRSRAGHTALLLTVFHDQPPEIAELLLAAGADPTIVARCEAGCSATGGDALDWARDLDREELVPVLAAASGDR